MTVTSCQEASAAGWVEKSNGKAVVAPAPTKNYKPWGSPAFAVGERLFQRESPSLWKAKDRKGGAQLDQTL